MVPPFRRKFALHHSLQMSICLERNTHFEHWIAINTNKYWFNFTMNRYFLEITNIYWFTLLNTIDLCRLRFFLFTLSISKVFGRRIGGFDFRLAQLKIKTVNKPKAETIHENCGAQLCDDDPIGSKHLRSDHHHQDDRYQYNNRNQFHNQVRPKVAPIYLHRTVNQWNRSHGSNDAYRRITPSNNQE